MLKPIQLDVSQITAEAQAEAHARNAAAMDTAKRVFQALHGIYGNVFFSRYQTGMVNDAGEDEGLLSAMRQWAFDLRDFDVETIKAALERAKARYVEFPPSLPQFSELCRALRPREVLGDRDAVARIPMSGELRSEYARQARAIISKHEQRATAPRAGAVVLPASLDGLKQAIALAVADAGGNEANELLRLDRMLAPRGHASEGAHG